DGSTITTGMIGDTNLAKSFAATNVLYYRVADDEPDSPAVDAGYDPRTLDRFAGWLSERYGYSDDILRSEWGPAFTLVTATPRVYSDALAAFSNDPTYAPWVDHRRFIMDLFSRAPAQAHLALRRGDPYALAGTSGERWTAMVMSRDWSVRGRALDVVGRYRT